MRDNKPLNDLMQQEMRYLTSKKFDEDGYESAGSDSDPSGDNLNEKELKKRLEGKKKVRKKRAGRGKRLVRNSVGSRRSRIGTPETEGVVGGEGCNEKVNGPGQGVDKKKLKLPKRPPGKKTNRSSFTEGLYSRTPRAKSESERMQIPGESGTLGARSRAQSANAVDRRSSGRNGSIGSDPRFVMEGNVRVMPQRRSMLGSGLGGAASGGVTRTGTSKRARGINGGSCGGKGDSLAVRVQQEVAQVRRDVMRNLDFRIGGIGGGEGGGGGGGGDVGWTGGPKSGGRGGKGANNS